MRSDTFTNTVEDAAAYEQLRGRDAWIDDRPTGAELDDERLVECDDMDDLERPDPWENQ